MKSLLVLPLLLSCMFPTKLQASKTYNVNSVCEKFADGKIDALKTFEALDLNIDDYSIGINNTVKIFCA